MITIVFKGRDYIYSYWVSLDEEAALRNIDPCKDEDEAALEHLANTLIGHILRHSALNVRSIICHYFHGKDTDGRGDDDGFVVVVGHGVNKKLHTRLTKAQMAEREKAMKE
ncbi:hypothetical protein FRC10_008813, partial [Ceratobasidium sp. 414]